MSQLFAVFDLDDDQSVSREIHGWARDGTPMVIDPDGKRLVSAARFSNFRGIERAGQQTQSTAEPKAEFGGEIHHFSDGTWVEV